MVDPPEDSGFIDLDFVEIDRETMLSKARLFYEQMDCRRTTRHFSNREVPRELIELAIRTASTAPSGAHLQPWTFVAISDKELKEAIREEAEKEEKAALRSKCCPVVSFGAQAAAHQVVDPIPCPSGLGPAARHLFRIVCRLLPAIDDLIIQLLINLVHCLLIS